MVRQRPCRRDRRRAHLERRARRAGSRARPQEGVSDLGRGRLGFDRKGLLADLDPLDLRHRGAGQRHRRRGGQSGRQYLVLHHRRLRLWPRLGTRHDAGRRGQWRQGPGLGQGAAQDRRFLILPAAGAGVEGEDRRPRQLLAATRSTRSSRRPNSVSSPAARSSPGCWCSSATSTASGSKPRRGCS